MKLNLSSNKQKREDRHNGPLKVLRYKEVNVMHEYHLHLKKLFSEGKITKDEMIRLLKENNYYANIKCSVA